jgi:hypothetical protein
MPFFGLIKLRISAKLEATEGSHLKSFEPNYMNNKKDLSKSLRKNELSRSELLYLNKDFFVLEVNV